MIASTLRRQGGQYAQQLKNGMRKSRSIIGVAAGHIEGIRNVVVVCMHLWKPAVSNMKYRCPPAKDSIDSTGKQVAAHAY
eukprot:scaffold60520_cov20-Prasinocladus_malaysianus.AAC.1